MTNDRIEVLEYKTNRPLASVRINFYRCSNYDDVFGCRAKQIFATGITDDAGKYTFKPGELNKANEGIVLHKSGYWDANGGTGKRYMSPEAWINLHLTRQNSYPDTSLFRFNVIGESGFGSSNTFKIPDDTTIRIHARGNELNTFGWVVILKDLHCYQYCILDTLAKGGFMQALDKSGTVSRSLSY